MSAESLPGRSSSTVAPVLPATHRPSRLGIRSRVMALALMGMALPAVLASAYFETRARDRLRHAEGRATEEALAGAREFNMLVAQARLLSTTLAAIPEVRRGEGSGCAEALRRLLPLAGWLASLAVARADGVVLCATDPAATGVSIGDQPHVRRAVATRGFVLSDLAMSQSRHASPLLHATEPVLRADGEVDILILAAIDPDWLLQKVVARFEEGRRISIVDGQGVMVARYPPIPGAIGRSFEANPVLLAARAHPAGHVRGTGLDGHPIVLGFASVEASEAKVYVGREAAAILGPIEAESRSSYLVLVLSGVLVLWVGLAGGEWLLIRPIAALRRTIDQLAEGDLSARARLGQFSAPELAALARQVALMAERLAEKERDLIAARDAATAASVAKSWFLGAASHELRTPLNSVLGWTQALLIDPRLPLALRDQVEDIGRAGWRLNEIASRLLEATRLEAEAPQPGEVDPAGLGKACLDLVRPAAAEAGLALVLEAAPALPPRLRADERRLRHILRSLLENAVQFGRGGEVRLRLSWQDAAGQLRAEVLDHGPGVPVALRNRLFQDFAHQDPGGKAGRGLGLGLSVSARLAAQLGGEVGHADRPDGLPGSLFWLQVPAPRAA